MNGKIMSKFAAVFAAAILAGSAFGAWEFSVGPAWRSRAKSRISGSAQITPPAASFTSVYDKPLPTTGWTGTEPDIIYPVSDPLTGWDMYGVTATRTDTTVTPGAESGSFNASDSDSTMGLKANATWNFYEEGALAIGINFRFAAYWGVRSTVHGSAGGTTTVSTFTDTFLFGSGPFGPFVPTAPGSPTWPDFPLDSTSSMSELKNSTTTPHPASAMRARIKGDLYQLGVGPHVSYGVFDWLDLYGGASVLCNLVHMDFDVNGRSSTDTSCELGFGGEVGAVAWFTENVGIYADVGYEWIDESDMKIGGAKAKIDFSSLVLSAGLAITF